MRTRKTVDASTRWALLQVASALSTVVKRRAVAGSKREEQTGGRWMANGRTMVDGNRAGEPCDSAAALFQIKIEPGAGFHATGREDLPPGDLAMGRSWSVLLAG